MAALVFGLPSESRIKRRLRKEKYTLEEVLLMNILDQLRILTWQNTKNGRNGTNYPESIFRKLCFETQEDKKNNELIKYEDSEDFDSMWNRLKGQRNG